MEQDDESGGRGVRSRLVGYDRLYRVESNSPTNRLRGLVINKLERALRTLGPETESHVKKAESDAYLS